MNLFVFNKQKDKRMRFGKSHTSAGFSFLSHRAHERQADY